jgi:anti-sigma regulatory factor (Ser/Thr protein kinase)
LSQDYENQGGHRMTLTLSRAHTSQGFAEFRLGFLAEDVAGFVARKTVRAALEIWNLSCLVDSSLVVINEMVTNAAKAAPGDWMEICVRRIPKGVILECWDSSPELPEAPGPPDLDAEGGRGMFVIAACSAEYGINPEQYRCGKTVWALMTPEHENLCS